MKIESNTQDLSRNLYTTKGPGQCNKIPNCSDF
uniref:Uncharacterized protein n=1 Tax=Rhizophora mucronata TaxID=61149 RepID=A0A2P2MPX1_RHIMU